MVFALNEVPATPAKKNMKLQHIKYKIGLKIYDFVSFTPHFKLKGVQPIFWSILNVKFI